jgi:YcxB-like protein
VAESDTVSVVVTIIKKDYAAAVRGMMRPRTALLWNVLFGVSLAVLTYFAYEAIRIGATNDISGLLWAAGIVLFVGFFRFATPLVAARDFVRKNPNALGPVTQTVSSSGVRVQGERGEGTSPWNAYQRVRETRDLFLLYAQSNFAIIVPKRCFSSPDEIERYRQIIRRYCPGTLELKN